jgi:hypothetical protein
MFVLKIDTGNAAFEDDPNYELARILRAVADKVENGHADGRCYDINGNKVGSWAVGVVDIPNPE